MRAALVLAAWLTGCCLSTGEGDEAPEPAAPAACDFELAAEGDLGPAPEGACWRIRSALDARVAEPGGDVCQASTCLVLAPGMGALEVWGAAGYDGPAPFIDAVDCAVKCPGE